MSDKIVGYKISRPDVGGFWMFAGTTPDEVAEVIKSEIAEGDGLSADECGSLLIEAYETTQEEIDSLPEFGGW